MLNSVNQRLRFFKDSLGLNTTEFATELGTSQSAMSHILAGRRPLSRGMIARIKRQYPKLNEAWLLTGEGDMVVCSSSSGNISYVNRDGTQQVANSGSIIANNPMLSGQYTEVEETYIELTINSDPKDLMAEIHRLRSMLFSKDEEIKRLKEKLK